MKFNEKKFLENILLVKSSSTQRTEGALNPNFRASGFFESLKHNKQDLRIIEFENQVWNSLHKLAVWKGELILILGSKIHNLWTNFYLRTKISLKIQPEIQKS